MIRKTYHRWTKEEEAFLENNYPKLSLQEIATRLKRSISSVKNKNIRFEGRRPRRIVISRFNLSEEDLAYLAGLVDGEGTITIGQNRGFLNPYLNITNTSPQLLKWMKQKVSVGSIYEKNHGEAWEWRINGYGILPALEQIKPYLVVKRLQAESLIAFIKERQLLSEWEFHLTPKMKKLYRLIRLLNSRECGRSMKKRDEIYQECLRELSKTTAL